MTRVDRPTVEQAFGEEPGASSCRKCGTRIHGGQLWLPASHTHVACPSPDAIRRARLWDRARAILAGRT